MRGALILSVAVAIAGCSVRLGVSPIPAGDGPPAPWLECQAAEYLYIGDNTLDALGLKSVTGFDGSRVGMIWVTADLIGPEINFPGLERPSRMFCLQSPGSNGSTSGLVDATWQPPLLAAENSPDDSSAAQPAGLLLIALTLVVATGLSVFAFRRRPETPRS